MGEKRHRADLKYPGRDTPTGPQGQIGLHTLQIHVSVSRFMLYFQLSQPLVRDYRLDKLCPHIYQSSTISRRAFLRGEAGCP